MFLSSCQRKGRRGYPLRTPPLAPPLRGEGNKLMLDASTRVNSIEVSCRSCTSKIRTPHHRHFVRHNTLPACDQTVRAVTVAAVRKDVALPVVVRKVAESADAILALSSDHATSTFAMAATMAWPQAFVLIGKSKA